MEKILYNRRFLKRIFKQNFFSSTLNILSFCNFNSPIVTKEKKKKKNL